MINLKHLISDVSVEFRKWFDVEDSIAAGPRAGEHPGLSPLQKARRREGKVHPAADGQRQRRPVQCSRSIRRGGCHVPEAPTVRWRWRQGECQARCGPASTLSPPLRGPWSAQEGSVHVACDPVPCSRNAWSRSPFARDNILFAFILSPGSSGQAAEWLHPNKNIAALVFLLGTCESGWVLWLGS